MTTKLGLKSGDLLTSVDNKGLWLVVAFESKADELHAVCLVTRGNTPSCAVGPLGKGLITLGKGLITLTYFRVIGNVLEAGPKILEEYKKWLKSE